MSNSELVARLNANLPPSMQTLGGKIVDFDQDGRCARIAFDADSSMCNPGGGVQGGFICGMLDAAMAFSVFSTLGEFAIVATLEIKVNYLEITRPGPLSAVGRVVRLGKTISFLDAELRDSGNTLLATATQTARVIRKPPDGGSG